MSFDVLAEGLEFPEGPIIMPDGSVILVEIRRGTLTRVWNGRTEVIAELGGGPNGAAIGPDGAVYVCNNGGFDWVLMAEHRAAFAGTGYSGGRIERVDPATGRFERVYDAAGGHSLAGPNDIVFDRTGQFWFSDMGKTFLRNRLHSGLYRARPDGTLIQEVVYPALSFNGVGLSPDEQTVYAADTDTARLWAFDRAVLESDDVPVKRHAGRIIGAGAPTHMFDSLAVEADGRICVATIGAGISAITPQGDVEVTTLPDAIVTNICFGGTDMRDAYITMSQTGRLIKMRWPRPGLKLNFCPYP